MKWVPRLLTAALLLAVAFPVAGSVWPGDNQPLALLFFVLALFWHWQQRRGANEGRLTAVFAGYVAALALAGYMGVAAFWLLPGMVAALVAWDVGLLARRLTAVSHITNEALLLQQHLRWLLRVVGLSLLLGGAALLFRISLSYGIAFALAMVVFFAVGRVLHGIVRS